MFDLGELYKPFPRDAIHWRAARLTKNKDKAQALAYLDARDVMGRLDRVCGPMNWQDEYEETAAGRVLCNLSVRINDEWITKTDGAGNTDYEGEKGAISGAFKRAAVKFGIGRYLYDLDAPWVPCEVTDKGQFRKFTEDPWKFVRSVAHVDIQSDDSPTAFSDSILRDFDPKAPNIVKARAVADALIKQWERKPTLKQLHNEWDRRQPDLSRLERFEDEHRRVTAAFETREVELQPAQEAAE